MRKINLLTLLSICLCGCSSIDKEWIKESMQKSVDKCNGKVTSITMIKEGTFSNKFDGYVEVKVRGKNYYPDITALADGETSFYRSSKDICEIIKIENEMNNMQRRLGFWLQKDGEKCAGGYCYPISETCPIPSPQVLKPSKTTDTLSMLYQ